MRQSQHQACPAASVVIPTYNRQQLLRKSLESLAAQNFDLSRLQVIVSDDGSSDETSQVVRSFSKKLCLEYIFQPDEGNRVAAARNAGARVVKAPVVIFLDSGVLAGPDLVSAHLAAHKSHPYGVRGPVVLGYTYGYNLFVPYPGLDAILAHRSPGEVHDLLQNDARFRDMRHRDFSRFGFDLGRMLTPWVLCWGMNVSMRITDFRGVGGFDEEFRDWGGEDVDLGWRLASHGVPFVVSREAWAIEAPHERNLEVMIASNCRNVARVFEKMPALLTEMYAAVYSKRPVAPLEDEYRAVLAWAQTARAEIPEPSWGLHAGDQHEKRIAVFGCGATPSPDGGDLMLVDFDDELLRQRSDRIAPVHGLGVRTNHPDGAFDIVVVTARLSGIWRRWGEEVRAEAARLAPEIRVLVPE